MKRASLGQSGLGLTGESGLWAAGSRRPPPGAPAAASHGTKGDPLTHIEQI